jgi:transcriptional regulator with AAA-type ATPase domain/tetratricopeptide (TPR) repeat protein
MTALASLLGESPGITAVREQIARLLRHQGEAARRLPPILILGETGTGKGLLAELVHREGPRASGPFVDVNCAAIPETLLEAELFGFEKGAFTDARQAKPGLFQAAHGGTIFLDEIGLMPEALQAKLLKVIEEGAVRRLGSTRREPTNAWVIAATSEDLQEAVRARRFREDLYHRLAVLPVRLPPLRERGADVVQLAEHFLAQACEDYGLPARELSPGARDALRAYAWPGNVRELANAMERVALLTDVRTVTAEALALPSRAEGTGTPATGRGDGGERARLLEALEATQWNLSRAAARLGIPRNTLRYRVEKLGLGASRSPVAAATGSPGPPSDAVPPPVRPGMPAASVRWESRRVTLLRVAMPSGEGVPGAADTSRFMEAVLDKVQSFGGQVDELSPRGVVAAFGLEPEEDASRRAAHVAVAVQKVAARARTYDPERPLPRLAIHAGLVLVGRLGDHVQLDADSRRAPRAVLDTLLDLAEPGTTIVSGDAAPFLARRFELAPATAAPGLVLLAYRLGSHADVAPGPSRFVGRQADLRYLVDRLAQAESGQGQVVSLVGEAGIGKSRLLHELHREVAGHARWLEGQAVSYGRSIPFHAVIDLVRRVCHVDEADPPATIAAKLEHHVASLGEDLRSTLPCLRYLFSVQVDESDAALLALDPKLRRVELSDALRRLFVRAAELGPVVVGFEDMHWADPATQELLEQLADSLATRRILLILTMRPGHPSPIADRTFHARLALSTLSAVDSVTMARALLADEPLPEALERLVVRKAEGNPFFVEELVRSLQETGAVRSTGSGVVLARELDQIVVPDTVHDVILARLERLDEAPRATLQVASVIGRDFTGRLLERVGIPGGRADAALRELKSLELIYDKGLSTEPGYTFRHALTQEGAYGSLPAARRLALHLAIGRAIEELYADRLAEHYEVLAHHFSRAEAWEPAAAYLVKAADKAARTFATREALALYDEALAVAGRLEEASARPILASIHRAKTTLYFVLSDFDRSRDEAERLLALARRAADRPLEAIALGHIGWAKTWLRDLPGAVAAARSALEVAEDAGTRVVLPRAHFTIGWVTAVTGHLQEADTNLKRALSESLAANDVVHRSLSLSALGLMHNWTGAFGDAARLQAEALALARQHDLLVPLLVGFFLYGLTLIGKGDYDDAQATLREGLALAERLGDEAIHHRLLNCLGWLHAELGDFEVAIDLNRRSEEIGRRRSDPGTFPNAALNLGEILLARGELGPAGEQLEGVLRYSLDPTTSEWMRYRYSIRLFVALGELALARGQIALAREHAARGLDHATRTGSRKNLVKAWRLTGEIATHERRWEDAEAALRQALGFAEAIANPPQLWRTHAAIARLHEARGRADAAGEARARARGVVERLRATLIHPDLRRSLRDPVLDA